jgi:predicted nucleic acid-binding protein
VAARLRGEARHADAAAVFERLARERWHLYTINVTVAEAQTLILRARGGPIAAALAEVYGSQGTTVEPVTRADEQRAIAILTRYADKEFSFADTLAFAVCERLEIQYAFSFDRHFQQYGRLQVLDGEESW